MAALDVSYASAAHLGSSQSAPMASPSSSFSLTDWHRRRRRRDGLSLSPRDSAQSPLGSPEPEVFPDAQGSPPIDGFPDDSPAFGSGFPAPSCFSPVTCPSPAEWNRDDLVRRNTRFVRWEYEFGCVLGEGSFGQVYEATHRRTGTVRAIKEIPKSGTETEEFEWELEALVALDHPHIVSVVEWFDDKNNYYLAMEMCTGPDLFKFILNAIDDPDGPGMVTETHASVILRQCLKAVLCCHANGFIHRDLNAKNFMITGTDRTVKLIDFGLAKRFLGFMPTNRFIEVVGTSHYMSPEMLLDGEYSPAADLWSMGVLLYVMLTGTMLLPKDDDRKRRLLSQKGYVRRRLENCKILQQRKVSAHARNMLERMLQHDPPKRISAADALLHPFILNDCNDYLGPSLDECLEFDKDIILKMRSFAKAPRLRKVAVLIITHLSDHERGLLAVKHMFRTLDTDGDGVISLADLMLGLSVHGIEAPPDLEEMFMACDSNRSGRLSFQEFVCSQLPTDLIDERLCHEAFNLLDTESKGWISADDLQIVCRSHPLEKCQKMVSQADIAGKGFFDFEDFHRFLRGEDAAPIAQSSQMPRPDTVPFKSEVIAEPPRKIARYDSGLSPTTVAPTKAPCLRGGTSCTSLDEVQDVQTDRGGGASPQ